MAAVLKKHDIEAALHAESKDIAAGRLKEDNPLLETEDFRLLCAACRRGDLKACQEQVQKGVNINARDSAMLTAVVRPQASLCGHFEVVRLLLESGALCERDTFQGERCLYNALNDRIRNLLLQYDYSKSTDPLQPLAAHITALLTREIPNTSDISVVTDRGEPKLHKFLLSARSPYFAKKLEAAPETTQWRLPPSIPPDSFLVAMKYLYLSERTIDLGAASDQEEEEILKGIDKISKHLEIDRLFEYILERADRRLTRQRRQDEVARGREQLHTWFADHVLKHRIVIDTDKVEDVRWDRENGIFADVLLQADEQLDEDEEQTAPGRPAARATDGALNGLPIGNFHNRSRSASPRRSARKSVLYPCHRAMLTRSEYFMAMFSSAFREAQVTRYLPVIPMSCTPEVLEIVLTYLYTERADFGLSVAIDVLFAADLLFLEKLKARAALIISTLGSGAKGGAVEADNPRGAALSATGGGGGGGGGGSSGSDDEVDIYEIIRAGWDTRMHRLEEFGARFIADRLERFIDEAEFAELVRESAGRIRERQETDTVELVDDIRYYLSERFRLRFEDAGLEGMLDDADADSASIPPAAAPSAKPPDSDQDEGVDMHGATPPPRAEDAGFAPELEAMAGVVRTLDGGEVDDEFAQDALNYQILLGKIDALLDSLKLDA